MTLPVNNISMSQVNVELSKSATAQISLNDAAVRTLAGVPSGQIGMNNLLGKSAYNGPPTVEYLVVAGGGGGGSSYCGGSGVGVPFTQGGGGGAGGYLSGTSPAISKGTTYPFTVGGGGSRGAGVTNGGNSTAFGVTSVGGGHGGQYGSSGNSGGSGGGGDILVNLDEYPVFQINYIYTSYGGANTGGQGNFGGASSTVTCDSQAGGGGGIGSAGSSNGTAGSGTANSISGSSITYAVGGTGQSGCGCEPGPAGTANRGNGGGGGTTGCGCRIGGNGGSGVVIIRHANTYSTGTTTGSPSIVDTGGYKVYTFTGSGSVVWNS